jgi:hypothetical protein
MHCTALHCTACTVLHCTACPFPDEVLLYIRNLEDRVGQLESGGDFPSLLPAKLPAALPAKEAHRPEAALEEPTEEGGVRPEAVSAAMKVNGCTALHCTLVEG